MKPDFEKIDFAGYSARDEYNFRGDVLELLKSHQWKPGEVTEMKTCLTRNDGERGNLYCDGTFTVETSTADFEADMEYKPFHVFAKLEANGDYKEAEIKLKNLGFGLKQNERKRKTNYPEFICSDGSIDAWKLKESLEARGLIRISNPGEDFLKVFRIEKKILKPFNIKSDTISFIVSQLNENQKSEVSNLIFKQRNAVNNIFQLMPGVAYDLQRDTKNDVFFPFSNGVLKVQSDSVELLSYESELLKYFVETESSKHEIKITDFQNRIPGNFEKFLLYAIIGRVTTYNELSDIERRDVSAFHSMMGYLLSNYKNPAKTRAVILTDFGADDESRRGRRGKSLVWEAIKKFRHTEKRGGTEFDPTYRHRYAGLDERTNIFVLDDVAAKFDYNSLYTQIVSDIVLEPKGTAAVEIPFNKAPKFVVTTNWAVRYDREADSTNDRFTEFKFSNFWNITNKPDAWFKELFFQDWNDAEWQLFFEFMISCVMYYLKNGLQEIKYKKEDDNFLAYFSNDVLLQEFERVFSEMNYKLQTEGKFTTQDFLDVHKQKYQYNNQLFNHINAKRFITAYSDKSGIGLVQNNRREWVSNLVSDFVAKDTIKEILPF